MKKLHISLWGLFCLFALNAQGLSTETRSGTAQSRFYGAAQIGWGRRSGDRLFQIQDLNQNTFQISQDSPRTNSILLGIGVGYVHDFTLSSIAIEPYVNLTSGIQDKCVKSVGGDQHTIQLSRPWSAGIDVRPGLFVHKKAWRAFGLIGFDSGRFKLSWQDQSGNKLETQSSLSGFNVGMGVERHFRRVRLGIQVKGTLYGTKTISVSDDDGTYQAKTSPRILAVSLRLVAPF
jgi:hypothetical protein